MADLPQLPSPADYEDVSASDGQAPAENKESIFVGILETLQHNNFLLMNLSESADEIEENTEDDESQTEKRNRRINEENTDKKPGVFSKAIGGLGAGVKGVGGILNKANPFQEGGLGTKMSILLISGVLFAISKFGDKLIKPLASVLEMFDGEGGVLEKIKNSDLFKGIVDTFDTMGEDIKTGFNDAIATFTKIKDAVSGMGISIESLLGAITTAVGFVKGAYDSVMAYINSFDTQGSGPRNEYGDGKLDAFELQNLKDDLMKKAQDLVTSIIGTVWNEISLATKLMFAAGGVVSILLQGSLVARIAKMIAGVSGAKPPPSADGPKTRSSRGGIVRNLAKSLVVGTSAFSSSVGGTTAAASLKPGQAINKAGSIYSTKTGQIIKPASAFSHLSKYPRLMSVAKRIPLLTPILTGAMAVNTMTNDELSKDEKAVAMGGILGGGLGAMGFGALGGTLGTMFGPPGTIIGSILGSLTGFVAGEKLGELLMGFLLGKESEAGSTSTSLQSSSTIGEMNASTGTVQAVENLPISKITSASSNDHGNFSQANAVSQLQGNLMNRNTDLALAAYEADKAKKLSNTTPLPGGRGDAPISMPVVVDKGQVTNIQSNYGSTLSVDNGNRTSRLFTDSLLIDVRSAYAGQ